MEATPDGIIVRKGLRRVLGTIAELREARRISDVRKIFVGMEADVWAFQVQIGSEGHTRTNHYVVKLFARSDAPRATDEMDGLCAMRTIGLSCPRALGASEETAMFGHPYLVMEYIDGRSLKQVFYDTPLEDRKGVIDRFCEVFVQLHQTDWTAARAELLNWEEKEPYGYLLGRLPALLDRIKRLGDPGFVPVWNWLGERLCDVPCLRPAILHGDFHPGNVILPPRGPPVIIDWGGAGIGDPRYDVAWSMLLVGAYETEVRDQILSEYGRRAGGGLAGMEYFEVLACLVRLLSLAESWEYVLGRFRARGAVELELLKLGEHIEGIRRLLQRHTGYRVTKLDHMLEVLAKASLGSHGRRR